MYIYKRSCHVRWSVGPIVKLESPGVRWRIFPCAGDVVTLWNLDFVWTALICCLMSRRLPSIKLSGAVFLTIVGVVLIQKPSFVFRANHSSDRSEGNDDKALEFPHVQVGSCQSMSSIHDIQACATMILLIY